MKIFRCLIVAKQFDQECVDLTGRAAALLLEKVPGCEVLFDSEQTLTKIHKVKRQGYRVFGAADEQLIDYAVSIGGDGTLLYLMSKFQHRSSPPVFIFSKGTLGFLCIYSVDSLEKVLGDLADLLAQGKAPHTKQIDRLHMVAEYCGQRQEYHALNEVFVTKGRNIRPVYLQVTLNEEHFTNTKGDGLIVSTPTGSTAYALSAGGPILSQEARSILLVPVSPLSLSFRPVILPDSTNIKIQVRPLPVRGGAGRGRGLLRRPAQPIAAGQDAGPDEKERPPAERGGARGRGHPAAFPAQGEDHAEVEQPVQLRIVTICQFLVMSAHLTVVVMFDSTKEKAILKTLCELSEGCSPLPWADSLPRQRRPLPKPLQPRPVKDNQFYTLTPVNYRIGKAEAKGEAARRIRTISFSKARRKTRSLCKREKSAEQKPQPRKEGGLARYREVIARVLGSDLFR